MKIVRYFFFSLSLVYIVDSLNLKHNYKQDDLIHIMKTQGIDFDINI